MLLLLLLLLLLAALSTLLLLGLQSITSVYQLSACFDLRCVRRSGYVLKCK
jgi:hypothetical protein